MFYEWLAFATIMALGQFSPGPDMILLTRTALADGARAGRATALGIATGLMIHAALAVLGVAVLLHQNEFIAKLVIALAVGYLFWLGLGLLKNAIRKNSRPVSSGNSSEVSSFTHWKRGFLCNIMNPKVAIFLAGVMTPFLGGEHDAQYRWLLWVTVWLEGAILWVLWAYVLQYRGVKMRYEQSARWLDGAFGLTLWGMALFLGFKSLT